MGDIAEKDHQGRHAQHTAHNMPSATLVCMTAALRELGTKTAVATRVPQAIRAGCSTTVMEMAPQQQSLARREAMVPSVWLFHVSRRFIGGDALRRGPFKPRQHMRYLGGYFRRLCRSSVSSDILMFDRSYVEEFRFCFGA
jgi:hypothetical protein